MPPIEIALSIANRVGELAKVTKILAEAGVNVLGLNLGRGPDKMNLRLMVDKPDVAIAELARRGFEAKRTEVLSHRVSNRPGAIAEAAERLAERGVNVEAVFLSAKTAKRLELVLHVDDIDAARKALRQGEEE